MVLAPLLQSKEHAFQGRMCSEFARLRRVQADLEQETGHTCFLGRSVVKKSVIPISLFKGLVLRFQWGWRLRASAPASLGRSLVHTARGCVSVRHMSVCLLWLWAVHR